MTSKMEEDESMLARWSRLKREHTGQKNKQGAAESAPDAAPVSPLPSKPSAEEAAEPFDVSRLPPLESIVAGSDVRAFLQKGVPAALTRAALRKAWSSDPAIRDFIEMAENQWNFASPDSIPGFGSLTDADDVSQLVAKALGNWGNDDEPGTQTGVADSPAANSPQPHSHAASSPQSVQHPDATEISCPRAEQSSADEDEVSGAPHQNRCDAADEPSTTPPGRRGHGGALPS